MPRYQVRFCNDLVDSYGHETRACQAAIELESPTAEEAAERAKRLFETAEGVAHWRHRAHTVHCEELT